jgi:hypothetical protein
VSLHQNKSANNRQPHDFAISHDEGKVLRRCKQISRTKSEMSGTEKREEGEGEQRRKRDRAKRETERATTSAHNFSRDVAVHRDRVDPLKRVYTAKLSENRERPPLGLPEQFAVNARDTIRYSPREKEKEIDRERERERACLSLIPFSLFSLFTGDAKDATLVTPGNVIFSRVPLTLGAHRP